MSETRELKRDVDDARAKLEEMEQAATDTAFIRRLGREAPNHPLLMLWKLFAAVGGLLGIGVAVVLVAPLVSSDAAAFIARMDVLPMAPLPMLLGTLGLLAILLGFSMRQLAIIRAGQSPMLTGEHKQHQRLVSDVHRAEANRDLHDRLKRDRE